MEFDKSRVYTAVNADELPIGSKCVFADDLRELRRLVSIEDTSQVLIAIKGESYKYRFEQAKADCMGDTLFALAYLIEPPAEPKYKPFESVEKAMGAIKKHGGWVRVMNSLSILIEAVDAEKEDFIQKFTIQEKLQIMDKKRSSILRKQDIDLDAWNEMANTEKKKFIKQIAGLVTQNGVSKDFLHFLLQETIKLAEQGTFQSGEIV